MPYGCRRGCLAQSRRRRADAASHSSLHYQSIASRKHDPRHRAAVRQCARILPGGEARARDVRHRSCRTPSAAPPCPPPRRRLALAACQKDAAPERAASRAPSPPLPSRRRAGARSGGGGGSESGARRATCSSGTSTMATPTPSAIVVTSNVPAIQGSREREVSAAEQQSRGAAEQRSCKAAKQAPGSIPQTCRGRAGVRAA